MKHQRLAIITDLDPRSNPGANLVAFEYAMRAQADIRTEFWTSGTRFSKYSIPPLFNIRIRSESLDEGYLSFPRQSMWHKCIREIFSIRMLFSFLRWVRQFKPQIVWVHQIGNVFPYTIFLVLRILKIPRVFTLHDFGVLVPRKLFPEDLLCGSDNANILLLQSQKDSKVGQLLVKKTIKHQLLYFRSYIYRVVLLKGAIVVAISELQKFILESNGFRINSVIGNGINKCDCGITDTRVKNTLLFAGRLTGKGFNHVVDLVKSCSQLQLHIAGKIELLNEAQKLLNPDRYKFHGELSHEEISKLLHKVEFTAVFSDCFDVYPSLLLEAITHGSIPLTYPTVGNSNFARQISSNLEFDYRSSVQCSEIENVSENPLINLKMQTVSDSISSFDDAYAAYKSILQSILPKG
jgi:hypothetical protein